MPDVEHSTLVGGELHKPLGDSEAGTLSLVENIENAYLIQAPSGGTTADYIQIDTRTNRAINLTGRHIRLLAPFVRVKGNGTGDCGLILQEGVADTWGGLVWDYSDEEYMLVRLVGTTEPGNVSGGHNDLKGNSLISSFHDLHIGRLRLEDSTTPTVKSVYSKSDNALYFFDGTDEIELTSPTPWGSRVESYGASTTGEIYTTGAVAETTSSWFQFHAKVVSGLDGGGFSGVVHYKRETGGDVEIVHSEINGTGEGNIDVVAFADTGTQEVGLTGHTAGTTTTFTVSYLTENAALTGVVA